MLFYASLFLLCAVIGVISLWMYRSLNAIGKAVYRAFLPSSKSGEAKQDDKRQTAATTNGARVPWGWSRRSDEQRAEREYIPMRPKYTGVPPWGWPGNPHYQPEPWIQLRRPSVYQPHLRKRAHNVLYRRPAEQRGHNRTVLEARGGLGQEAAFEFAGRRYHLGLGARMGRTNAGGVAATSGWKGSRRKATLRPVPVTSMNASEHIPEADPLGTGRPGSQLHRKGWLYRSERFEWTKPELAVETAGATTDSSRTSGGSLRPWGW